MNNKEKNPFPFPLWDTGKNYYLPVISRLGENKIYSHSELTWDDVRSNPSAHDELLEAVRDCRAKIEACHENAMVAIKAKYACKQEDKDYEMPILPKTPNPIKRTIKRMTKKATSPIIKRRTRATIQKNPSLIRNSIDQDAIVNYKEISSRVTGTFLNGSSSERVLSPQLNGETSAAIEKSFDGSAPEPQDAHPNANSGEEISQSETESGEISAVSNKQTEVQQTASDQESNEKKTLPKRSVASKKAAIKKKPRKSLARRQSQRSTRRTRQTKLSLLEVEEVSETEQNETPQEAPSNEEIMDGNQDNIPSLQRSTEKNEAEESSTGEGDFPRVSIEAGSISCSVDVRRLTNEELRRSSGQSIEAIVPSCSEVSTEKADEQSFHLSLSGVSDGDEMMVAQSKEKRNSRMSRKRDSHRRSDESAQKRRRTAQNLMLKLQSVESIEEEKQTSSSADENATVDEPTKSGSNTQDTLVKAKRKPRIVKPSMKKKSPRKKSFLKSVKRKSRPPSSLLASSTPIRTRSKFMSPLLRTPNSSNINSTMKSFLIRNTPECTISKDAIIEAKKKQLEEKRRQNEERQRLMEEKRKEKLAETKQKREQRTMRAIRIREMKEKEERERQDQNQEKWEQRIAVAAKTQSKRKLETTAKVTKEMEKIAKAVAKRKEEEDEKLQKLKEQEEAENARRVEVAALKKKQEKEVKKKKEQEKLEKMKKKAELEREAMRKQKLEEKRLAKEQEEEKREQEERAREEKMRQEKEAEDERERKALLLEKKKEAHRQRKEERKLQLERQKLEKEKEEAEQQRQLAVEREKAEKRKEMIRQKLEAKKLQFEKQKQEEERRRLAKEEECQRKIKEAEERIQKLMACPAEEIHHTSNTTFIEAPNNTFTHDASVNNYDMTPRGPGRPLLPSTAENYNIDDFGSDDSTDDEDKPRKVVPSWAKGALFHTAIIQQYRHAPDINNIFPMALLEPVDLSSMFPSVSTNQRYFKRTSSAQWNSPMMPAGHISFTDQCRGFK